MEILRRRAERPGTKNRRRRVLVAARPGRSSGQVMASGPPARRRWRRCGPRGDSAHLEVGWRISAYGRPPVPVSLPGDEGVIAVFGEQRLGSRGRASPAEDEPHRSGVGFSSGPSRPRRPRRPSSSGMGFQSASGMVRLRRLWRRRTVMEKRTFAGGRPGLRDGYRMSARICPLGA